MPAEYPPPVAQLIRLGKVEAWGHQSSADWPDYVAQFGLEPQHSPDLIRLLTATDLEGDEGSEDTDDDLTVWAALHAWRALGQLRAAAAVAPLLDLLDHADDDASFEEMPHVFGLIGPPALPLLQDHLAAHHHEYHHASASALGGIRQIAEQHPASRDSAVAILLHFLAQSADNDPAFNGFLIGELTDLQVTEALPLIEQVFAADRVDIMMTDWPLTQFQFGLISEDEMKARSVELTARRRAINAPIMAALDAVRDRLAEQGRSQPRKPTISPAKAKRKQAAAARKKNRPRK
ncbi:MAG: hypothetical protein M3Z04_13655 [Chloroflexota bacterium]|nr:hypothetical protein [Chloroflexota bacterium]